MNNEERSKYALKHPNDDNYLTKNALLAKIFRKLRWKPTVDICCTPGGGNATGPFYYDAESDALHQAAHLAGLDLMCNPAFDCTEKFINLLIEVYNKNDNTRAVLIVPERRSNQWFKDLIENKLFRLVFYWTKNMGIFSGANKVDSLAEDGRINYSTSFDNILVFEMNKNAPPYETVTFADMPDLRQDLVEQVLKLKDQKPDSEEEEDIAATTPPTAKLTLKERRKGWAESQRVICPDCNRGVLQKNLDAHKASNCRTEQCPHCPRKFSALEIGRHQLACSQGPSTLCFDCGKRFAKKSNLKRHRKKCSD